MTAPTVRRALSVVAVAALTLPLAACSALSASSDSSDTSAPADAEGALSVAVSFYPIQYLTEAIGGDYVSVTSVTPTNTEPHDYELSPKDVTALSSSQLVAYVQGFQPSLDDAISQVSGPTVLDLASSIDLVHHEDSEEHEDGEEIDGATAEATDEGHDHGADSAEALDPHFWLDPVRMKSAATAIEEALATADPNHASSYKNNLDTLDASLDDLDTSYSQSLGSCERTTFVTSHSAFGYLADRYGLTQASISGIEPEAEPSLAEIADIKEVVQSTGTTTIFTEELVSPETAETIANETGATTAVLNPIESQPESSDYAEAMRTNLGELRTALSCK